MNNLVETQTVLEELGDVFSQAAIESVNGFFGKNATIHLPWQVVEQLQANFDMILTMGSSNDRYSALTVAGIQHDSLSAFIEQDEVSQEEALDILGEFVNTYIAILADQQQFCNQFGTLTQAVPILYTDGQSLLPFIWGVQGYVYVDKHWIYLGYTVRENTD